MSLRAKAPGRSAFCIRDFFHSLVGLVFFIILCFSLLAFFFIELSGILQRYNSVISFARPGLLKHHLAAGFGSKQRLIDYFALLYPTTHK